MKRFLMLALAAVVSGFVFAQSFSQPTLQGLEENVSEDLEVETIVCEDKYPELHESAKSVQIILEYKPLTGEVRLKYTCKQSEFREGEAMNVAMAVYDDFALEHKYKHKRYREKDKTKFFKDNGVRMAQYSSYVVFTK